MQALTPRLVRPRAARASVHGPEVITALACCWAVLGAPTGKRLRRSMAELVLTLRRFDELVVTDDVDFASLAMLSPATVGPPVNAGPGEAAVQESFPFQAGIVVEGLDPDPDVGGMERRGTGVCLDRPGRARGRQRDR